MEFDEVRDILRPVIPRIKDIIRFIELIDEMEFSASVEQSIRAQVREHGMPLSSHLFFDAIRQKPRNFIRLMAALLKHGYNEIYDVIYHQIRFYFRDNPVGLKKVKDLIEGEKKRMKAVTHTPPEVNPVPRDGQEGEEPNGPPQPPDATGSSGVNEQQRMLIGRGRGRGISGGMGKDIGRGMSRGMRLQILVSSQEPGGPHRGGQSEALPVRPRPTVGNNSEEIPAGVSQNDEIIYSINNPTNQGTPARANQNDEIIYSRTNPANQGTPARANQNLPQPISPSDNTDNTLADVTISQLQANVYNKLANALNRPSTHQITEKWWNYILNNCNINISRGEQKNIKKAEHPGEELLDLLDERGYTIADLARLFEDMQMTDVLNLLREHQNKVVQTPARSEASPQSKADLARLYENNLNAATERSAKNVAEKCSSLNINSGSMTNNEQYQSLPPQTSSRREVKIDNTEIQPIQASVDKVITPNEGAKSKQGNSPLAMATPLRSNIPADTSVMRKIEDPHTKGTHAVESVGDPTGENSRPNSEREAVKLREDRVHQHDDDTSNLDSFHDIKEKNSEDTTSESLTADEQNLSHDFQTPSNRGVPDLNQTDVQSQPITHQGPSARGETVEEGGNFHVVSTSLPSNASEDTSVMQEIEEPPTKGTPAVASVGDPTGENSRPNSEREAVKLREDRVHQHDDDTSSLDSFHDIKEKKSEDTTSESLTADEQNLSHDFQTPSNRGVPDLTQTDVQSQPITHQGPSARGETVEESGNFHVVSTSLPSNASEDTSVMREIEDSPTKGTLAVASVGDPTGENSRPNSEREAVKLREDRVHQHDDDTPNLDSFHDIKEKHSEDTTSESLTADVQDLSHDFQTPSNRGVPDLTQTDVQSQPITHQGPSARGETVEEGGNFHVVSTSLPSNASEDTSVMQEIETPPTKGTLAVASVGDPTGENSRPNSEREAVKLREDRVHQHDDDTSNLDSFHDIKEKNSEDTTSESLTADEQNLSHDFQTPSNRGVPDLTQTDVQSQPITHQGPSARGETVEEGGNFHVVSTSLPSNASEDTSVMREIEDSPTKGTQAVSSVGDPTGENSQPNAEGESEKLREDRLHQQHDASINLTSYQDLKQINSEETTAVRQLSVGHDLSHDFQTPSNRGVPDLTQTTVQSQPITHQGPSARGETVEEGGNFHVVSTSLPSNASEDTSVMREIEDPPTKGTRAVESVGDPTGENSQPNAEGESEKLREDRLHQQHDASINLTSYQDLKQINSEETTAVRQLSVGHDLSHDFQTPSNRGVPDLIQTNVQSQTITHQGPSARGETVEEGGNLPHTEPTSLPSNVSEDTSVMREIEDPPTKGTQAVASVGDPTGEYSRPNSERDSEKLRDDCLHQQYYDGTNLDSYQDMNQGNLEEETAAVSLVINEQNLSHDFKTLSNIDEPDLVRPINPSQHIVHEGPTARGETMDEDGNQLSPKTPITRLELVEGPVLDPSTMQSYNEQKESENQPGCDDGENQDEGEQQSSGESDTESRSGNGSKDGDND